LERLRCRAAEKEQQHAPAADIVGKKSRVGRQRLKPEHLLVKCAGTVEVINVKRGLDDTG